MFRLSQRYWTLVSTSSDGRSGGGGGVVVVAVVALERPSDNLGTAAARPTTIKHSCVFYEPRVRGVVVAREDADRPSSKA
uniref:Secreted protein n=1 Tax=Plectus sambesii TaxID=2011161 RepID=A0A914VNM4_9BILA